MNRTVIQWLKERPLLLIVLFVAALGLLVFELLPQGAPSRKPMSDQPSWRFSGTGDCHPGAWILRIEADSVTLGHDGGPEKRVKATVHRPDNYAISATLGDDVGFGSKIRLLTVANLPNGRARLYLSRNAAVTECVHEMTIP